MFLDNLKELLKNKKLWIIFISFILAILIISFGGSLFAFMLPLSMRLLVAFVVFFGVVFAIMLQQIYFNQIPQDELINRAHSKIAKKQQLQEIKQQLIQIKEQFKQAVKLLKASSVYRNKQDASYELPWYFVIGNKGEGKTSLIAHSGLDFPLGQKFDLFETQHDGFKWNFTDEAILIDIDAKYLQPNKDFIDQSIWVKFLKLFKQKRWKRPVNGIILALSASTIAQQSIAQLEISAKALRDRLDEISNAFTSQIPIYILITKTDSIMGFNEYFGGLNDADTQEIFGIVFDDNKIINANNLQNEFDAFIKKIEGSLIDKIHIQWEREERNRVLLFPEEMGSLIAKLKTFIEIGFTQTRYRAPALLRSISFSGLESQRPNQSSSKALFLTNLFKKMIFSEAYMITMDQTSQFKEKIREKFAVVVISFFTVFVIGLWGWNYHTHTQEISALEAKITALSSDRQNASANISMEYVLIQLDHLKELRDAYTSQRYYFWEPAFFYSNARNEKIDTLYFAILEQKYLPLVAQTLSSETIHNLNDYDLTWENTKAYLMLYELDKRDPKFLAVWLDRIWQKKYLGDQELLKKLNFYWQDLLTHGFDKYVIDAQTIRTARKTLIGYGKEALLYKQLKDKAQTMKLGEFSINNILQDRSVFFVGGEHIIPGFFTHKGYQEVFLVDGKKLLKEIISANWVVGYKTEVKDKDLDAVYDKIQSYYFAEYKKIWLEAIFKIKLAQSLSIEQIVALTSQDSPIIPILKAVKQNTEIYSLSEMLEQKAQQATKGKANLPDSVINANAKSLRDQFKTYHLLLTEDGQASIILQGEMTRFANLSMQAESMVAADSGIDAFEAIANAKSTGTDAISPLPAPVSDWLPRTTKVNAGGGGSGAELANQAKKHIQANFTSQIYGFYKDKLAPKFPFNPSSANDVPLADFEAFFGPNGFVERFEAEYVEPFITLNPSGYGYQPKPSANSMISFDPALIKMLHHARAIKKVFFNSRGMEMSFYVKPHNLSDQLSVLGLKYDGNTILYEHGPIKSKKLIWPAQTGNPTAKFQVLDLNSKSVIGIEESGEWALFRLVNKLNSSNINQDETTISYTKNDDSAAFMFTGNGANAFGANGLIRTFKVPQGI